MQILHIDIRQYAKVLFDKFYGNQFKECSYRKRLSGEKSLKSLFSRKKYK